MSSTKENILKTYYDGVVQKIQAEIDYINRLIGHKGETGRSNERILVDLLLKFLPKRYSVGSGIIIDKDGNRSRQIDVIIYDAHFHPELFAQGTTILFPVDIVYMTIEVKTTFNKETIRQSIENIASVKQLKYIQREIVSLDHHEPETGHVASISKQPTSSPIGIIFGYNSETTNFNTYVSWLEPIQKMNKTEIFDFIYTLENTFFHGFEDISNKSKLVKGIFCLQDKGKCVECNESKKYENKTNGRAYPVVEVGEKHYVIDPALGFLHFLSLINDILSMKHVIQTSIIRQYLGTDLSNAFILD
jgi:hypothetical protein